MELETLNLKRICRTCKSVTPRMRSVFEGYQNPHEGPRIDEMLMACTSIQVTCGDGLPSQICQICAEQLNNAFVFKAQCESIDASLREYIKNAKGNEIKQEVQHSDFIEYPDTFSKSLNQEASTTIVTPKIETDYIQSLDNNQMLLTCHECDKIFTTLEGLHSHEHIHSSKMYKCKQCNKSFIKLNQLQLHKRTHSCRKVHVCRICSKTLTRVESLKRHLVTHVREKPYSCDTCNRCFSRLEHLQNHQSRCKGDTVYICDICNKAFNREDSLEVHKTMHDNLQLKLPTMENLDNVEDYYYPIDQEVNAVLSNQSDIDNNCFKQQVQVTEELGEDHMEEVGELTLKQEASSTSDASLGSEADDYNIDSSSERVVENLENIKQDTEEEHLVLEINCLEDTSFIVNGVGEDSVNSTVKPSHKILSSNNGCLSVRTIANEEKEEHDEFPCPACHKMFKTASSLDRHTRKKHEGLNVHKCKKCNREFSRADYLTRHLISHSSNKPFHCRECPKIFSRRIQLKKHQKSHNRSNDFECDVCQETFKQAILLENHKASKHSVEEKSKEKKTNYKCPLCGKNFATEKHRDAHVIGHKEQNKVCDKLDLTKHIKSDNQNVKNFLCSECGQWFSRNDYLVVHMRRHRGEKPFKCKYCGKGFPRTTDVTVHERCHTGEKTHLCTICGKSFGRPYNLTVHMRTHTGEKPYQCEQCDAAFSQKNDLTVHIRRHTGERFKCEFCSDTFLVRYLLTRHKQTVHGMEQS